MKIAKVIPLYKNDNNMMVNNDRPISILPVFSKLLERLMYNRLISFINQHKLLNKFQFGFRSQRSTNIALIYLVDKIAKAIDEKEIVLGVFLDFSKAFDTINHKKLFSKLNHYGIRGVALDWIQSYLNNRSQFVCFNDVNSRYSNITCGVPQGSILGPLLFLIYINDFSYIATLLFTILFADDTNIFLQGKNIDDLVKQMNLELSKIVMWLEVNRLSLNIKKTHFMIFATGNHSIHKYNEINQDIKINNIPIDRVHSTKFLGVYKDSKFNWSEHIKYIKGKLFKIIGIICKAGTLLNRSTLVTLYNSFVLPYI